MRSCLKGRIESAEVMHMGFISQIFHSITWFDLIILLVFAFNIYTYFECKKKTDTIYTHFNAQDKVSNLNEEQKEAVKKVTEGSSSVRLSPEELLNEREKMNEKYALFTTLTTIFPLMGMLGTVISLLNMTDLIGTEATGAFLGALTSTFWGIVAAIICKAIDTRISYKIEDNEKHMDYLFNPSKKQA